MTRDQQPGWLAGYHQALDDAAAECELRAKFLEDAAAFGGGIDDALARSGEATFLAERIRKMKGSGL